MSRHDIILVVDVECTCWEKPVRNCTENTNTMEIIEIGICSVDTNSLSIAAPKSIMVRPQHSTVSKFCEGLTGLRQEDVDLGITFPEACEILKTEYRSEWTCIASWGAFDCTQFHKDSKLHGLEYPFGRTHLNVKQLYSMWKNCGGRGLGKAIRQLGMEFKGVQHRGGDDAYNVARILVEIIRVMRYNGATSEA